MLDPRAPSMKLSSVLCFVCLGRSTALRYGQPVLNRPLSCRHWPRMAIELPQYAPTIEGEICGDRTVGGQTYHEQYKEIFAHELTTSKPLRKPRPAVANDPGAKRIPFSDVRAPKPRHRTTPVHITAPRHWQVWGTLMRSPFSKDRTWVSTDVGRAPQRTHAPSLSLSLAAPRELSINLDAHRGRSALLRVQPRGGRVCARALLQLAPPRPPLPALLRVRHGHHLLVPPTTGAPLVQVQKVRQTPNPNPSPTLTLALSLA